MRSRTLRFGKKLFRDTRGAEIAETAVVLPLMFMILLGIFWFSRAYNIYGTMIRASQEGAVVAANSTCATCASANQPTSVADVAAAVNSALQVSKLDPAQASPYAPSPAPVGCTGFGNAPQTDGKINVYRNVRLNPGTPGPEECGAIVSFQYPYQFPLPFTSLNMQVITLTTSSQVRMEN